jgi:predicted 3-demethylubiquinone-9 3-methyltransferase (glyoxalase superfamily)
MQIHSKIAPCLWFDSQAEEAAKFYTGIFRNSKIVATSRYGEAGKEVHGREPGTVMTVAFGRYHIAFCMPPSTNVCRRGIAELASARQRTAFPHA